MVNDAATAASGMTTGKMTGGDDEGKDGKYSDH